MCTAEHTDLQCTRLHPQLPPSLGHLPSLCKLSLNGNALSSLPEDLSGLGVLQELWLQGNALTALPEAIGQLQVAIV